MSTPIYEEKGLSSEQATKLQAEYGRNELITPFLKMD